MVTVTKECEVAGCACDQKTKGLCNKHYSRWLRGADPHTPSRQELSLVERFKAKLGPKDPVTGCIEWTGGGSGGYGTIKRDGHMVYTHRLAYELKHGPIPKGMKVCHTCDNPPCCNDEHLYLGTDADNMADKEAKGRGNQPKGVSNAKSKLTEADVAEIRLRIAAGETHRKIANYFGGDHKTVGQISRGKTWIHIK